MPSRIEEHIYFSDLEHKGGMGNRQIIVASLARRM